ncbi:unnamed protein product [Rhodiola kirilowii]
MRSRWLKSFRSHRSGSITIANRVDGEWARSIRIPTRSIRIPTSLHRSSDLASATTGCFFDFSLNFDRAIFFFPTLTFKSYRAVVGTSYKGSTLENGYGWVTVLEVVPSIKSDRRDESKIDGTIIYGGRRRRNY